MIVIDNRLSALLGQVFDRVREGKLPESEDATKYQQRKLDFEFHLTDWVSNLDELQAVLKSPDQFDVEAASNLIVAFLVHAIPHLNAAGKLLLDEISDPFMDAKRKSNQP